MPCDGAWPPVKVDLFERWVAEGASGAGMSHPSMLERVPWSAPPGLRRGPPGPCPGL